MVLNGDQVSAMIFAPLKNKDTKELVEVSRIYDS